MQTGVIHFFGALGPGEELTLPLITMFAAKAPTQGVSLRLLRAYSACRLLQRVSALASGLGCLCKRNVFGLSCLVVCGSWSCLEFFRPC